MVISEIALLSSDRRGRILGKQMQLCRRFALTGHSLLRGGTSRARNVPAPKKKLSRLTKTRQSTTIRPRGGRKSRRDKSAQSVKIENSGERRALLRENERAQRGRREGDNRPASDPRAFATARRRSSSGSEKDPMHSYAAFVHAQDHVFTIRGRCSGDIGFNPSNCACIPGPLPD